MDAIGRVFSSPGSRRDAPCAFRLSSVSATLRDAMPVLGEAVVLRAIPAAGSYETGEVLLLTEGQTSGINHTLLLRCLGSGREAGAKNHDQQKWKERKVTEVFFHKLLQVGQAKLLRCDGTIDP